MKKSGWECVQMHRKDTNDRQQGQLETMWEKLMSKVDWEEPTQITDHVLLRCTQCGSESEPNKMTVDKEKSELLNKLVSSSTSTITNFNNDTKHKVT